MCSYLQSSWCIIKHSSAAVSVFKFLIVFTVNYTNFLAFGVNVGDAQLLLDGSSPPINLSTPIQFFETTQHTLFVSQLGLYFHLYTGTIDDDGYFIYVLVVVNNNTVTDFCSS